MQQLVERARSTPPRTEIVPHLAVASAYVMADRLRRHPYAHVVPVRHDPLDKWLAAHDPLVAGERGGQLGVLLAQLRLARRRLLRSRDLLQRHFLARRLAKLAVDPLDGDSFIRAQVLRGSSVGA
eukprot:scaffold140920_cov30-Tisochrysis_lutea.AAC.1